MKVIEQMIENNQKSGISKGKQNLKCYTGALFSGEDRMKLEEFIGTRDRPILQDIIAVSVYTIQLCFT